MTNESTPQTEILVECQFPDRWDRQVVIKHAGLTLELNKVNSKSDEAKELALQLIWAGTTLLNHHELFKDEK